MPSDTNTPDIALAEVPQEVQEPTTEQTETVAEQPEGKKRGRPSKNAEVAAYIKATKQLADIITTLGGIENLRDLLDAMQTSKAA